MPISVIIPVYNAANYVRQAVESALAQPETGEVILVEDASPDDSLRVCEALAVEYPDRVRLLRHPNGANRGAAASRNLGIRAAAHDMIAFLDADDFYLPGRFSVSARILAEQPDVDGVYEAMHIHFDTPADDDRWQAMGRVSRYPFARMPVDIAPEDLFTFLLHPRTSGFCHMNALTVRRDALERVDLFSEHINAVEDTVLFRKLAAAARMMPGQQQEAVAMLRIHGLNRVSGKVRSAREIQHWRVLGWLEVWRWGRGPLSRPQKNMLLRGLVRYITRDIPANNLIEKSMAALRLREYLLRMLVAAPDLMVEWRFWFCFVPNVRFVIHWPGRIREYIRLRIREQS